MVKKNNRFIKYLLPFFIVGLLIILYLYPSYAGLSRLAGSKQLRGVYTRANSFASGINFFKSSCKNKQAIKYKLNNKSYCLLLADSPTKWSRGLMFYKKPVNFDGMIFIFPDKERLTFWNQNTYLDLDIYWLDNDRAVGKSFLLSIEKSKETIYVSSPKPANRVIEIIK